MISAPSIKFRMKPMYSRTCTRMSSFVLAPMRSSRSPRYGRISVFLEWITISTEKSRVLRKFWKPPMIAFCSSSLLSAKLREEHIIMPRYPPSLRMTIPLRTSSTGTNDWDAREDTILLLRLLILDIERPGKVFQLPLSEDELLAGRNCRSFKGRDTFLFSLFLPGIQAFFCVKRECSLNHVDQVLIVYLIECKTP